MTALSRGGRCSARLRAVFVSLGASLLLLAVAPRAFALNAIQAENAQPGDSHWPAALQDPVAGTPPIQGYADATGVLPGGTIDFHVSTDPVARYRIEISRLGWYGGSGGRRITCLEGLTPGTPGTAAANLDPACTGDEPGIEQPAPSAPDSVTGEVQAGWSTTDTLTVPADWTSGYYLAVFTLTSGPDAGKTGFTPFIVEAPPSDHSAILVQVPTNTWEAYNTWGGEGIYTTPEAVKASFNRPYSHRLLFSWEYPLVRFLERGGWDVSYTTDDAVDADPSILLGHALDMSAGHDEYWTTAMRTGWEAARDAGVNLAFMGSDDANWQVRYEDDRRTMVAYKYLTDPVTDPLQTTTMFRLLNPPRPECELMGVEFQGTVVPGSYLPYTADAAVSTDPWFAGTGLTAGSVLPGLGGYELDSITPGCHVPPVTPLLSYSGPAVKSNFGGAPTQADAVRYTACSGAEVFATGSLQFSWGLDSFRDPVYANVPAPESPALEEAMTRALGDLTVSHVPRPGPPDVCVPAPAFSDPSATLGVGQAVTVASTSTDPYGEIGRESWTLTGDIGVGRATRRIADTSVELPAPVRGAPIQVEFALRIAGRTVHERFLIPARSRSVSRARPQALTSVACDGTAGEVLTPAFGGPRSRPLRIAVTGDGPVTVTLAGPGTHAMTRHVRVAAGRSAVLTWASGRLHGGSYTVAVSAPRSWLPQPFTLAAVRAAPPRRRPPHRRRRQHPVRARLASAGWGRRR